MPITYVQAAGGSYANLPGLGSTQNFVINGVTAGNALILTLIPSNGGSNRQPITIADNNGATYTTVPPSVTVNQVRVGNPWHTWTWTKNAAGGNTTITVTASSTDGLNGGQWFIGEYSGMDSNTTVAAMDPQLMATGQSIAGGGSIDITFGPLTSTLTDDMVVLVAACDSTGTPPSAVTAGLTQKTTSNAFGYFNALTGAPGVKNYTVHMGGGSYHGSMIFFKANPVNAAAFFRFFS